MKKLIEEFRIAIAFFGNPKTDTEKDLRIAYESQSNIIKQFLDHYDKIERNNEKQLAQLNRCVEIAEAIIDFCKKENDNSYDQKRDLLKEQFEKQLDEKLLEKRIEIKEHKNNCNCAFIQGGDRVIHCIYKCLDCANKQKEKETHICNFKFIRQYTWSNLKNKIR